MGQNLIVAVAFVLASAWVVWNVLLPRSVREAIRTRVGVAPPRKPAGGCGGCCGGCGSEKQPPGGGC